MNLIHTNYVNTVPFSTNRTNYHVYVPSQTLLRKKKSKHLQVRLSNSAADGSVNGTVPRRSLAALQSAKSSSALEQLDIERGVCVPFRKYSPETVWFIYFYFFLHFYVEFCYVIAVCLIRIVNESSCLWTQRAWLGKRLTYIDC